jgi:hypothetical protein
LIFYKKYDIIYIESERKEMINMKVVRVKAKVVSPKLYTQEDMDSMRIELASCRCQIMGLKQKNAQLEADFDIEKKNHALATAGVQMWQRIANENEADARNWKTRADAAVKNKRDADDLALRAANDLTARFIKAMDKANVAQAEAANLRLELKERECRIDELVKRIKWLESQLPCKSTEVFS